MAVELKQADFYRQREVGGRQPEKNYGAPPTWRDSETSSVFP